ncbi:GntR family transcriptional regulator [Microbacterium caowuchunii]|uniref:GntR family transcriptional regulator n=1 Tax=Microbacterium caowuchunii TaxID=2614638 RepID=UPI00178043F8|nr:GntR family transcriptional regulator [Microbacterium caowuchunii]
MRTSPRHNGERVRDQIRIGLLNGQWEPGTKIQPAALAADYGTSTTVVREALTRLTGEGLLFVEPNRGFFVQDLTRTQLRDLTELRCRVEELAVSLAIERGDLTWESELIASHHTLAHTERRDPADPQHVSPAWAEAHRHFHAVLLEPCGLPLMLNLSGQLADATELYRQWAAPTSAASNRNVEKEHQDILDAAVARDAERAAALLRLHYEKTLEVITSSGVPKSDA